MKNVIGTSKELHRKFVILGNNRRKLTNELLVLLPEIYERGIYKIEDGKCTNLGFCKAAPQKVKIEIEGELLFMFLKMKKKYGNNLSNREVMKGVLEEAISQENGRKDKAAGKVCGKDSELSPVPGQSIISPSTEQKVEIFPGKKVSRYIETKIKKQTLSSTNGKCSYPCCEKPAENLHHPERFAESRNHENLKPLCKIHHEFMHNGLVENEKRQSGDWRLNLDGKLSEVDGLCGGYRKAEMNRYFVMEAQRFLSSLRFAS